MGVLKKVIELSTQVGKLIFTANEQQPKPRFYNSPPDPPMTVSFRKDTVVYSFDLTAAEAQELGDFLSTACFCGREDVE